MMKRFAPGNKEDQTSLPVSKVWPGGIVSFLIPLRGHSCSTFVVVCNFLSKDPLLSENILFLIIDMFNVKELNFKCCLFTIAMKLLNSVQFFKINHKKISFKSLLLCIFVRIQFFLLCLNTYNFFLIFVIRECNFLLCKKVTWCC